MRLLHTPLASCRATVRSAVPESVAMKVRHHLNQASRETLDEPVAHGVGGLEADMAAPRAFAQGQHENEALGIGHPGLLREPARPQDVPAAHAEGPAAIPAEVTLLAVL